MSAVKCKLCGRSFIDKAHLVNHIDKSHKTQIPDGWTAARYENYIRTGKTHGTCVICKCDTPWNDATEKYCRMCAKESCRKEARKRAEENLMKSKGITHSQMLNDPEFQRKMVYSKKTSGVYEFDDGDNTVKVMYDSSYGKDFLDMLEHFMGFCSCDIMGPSPNTYVYTYDGKPHFYVPDFYIPSLGFGIEVEIKDGGDNPNKHPKIQRVDKVKEALKDEAMKKQKVNYVKIVNKDYTAFYKMLFMLKEQDFQKTSKETQEFVYITESTESTLYKQMNSEQELVMWFYKQLSDVHDDMDAVSLCSKIDAMIVYLKQKINQSDGIYDDIEMAQRTIADLENIKSELWRDYKIGLD